MHFQNFEINEIIAQIKEILESGDSFRVKAF